MNCKIDTTPDFARDLKQLAKRYPSMKDDYRDFLDALRKSLCADRCCPKTIKLISKRHD